MKAKENNSVPGWTVSLLLEALKTGRPSMDRTMSDRMFGAATIGSLSFCMTSWRIAVLVCRTKSRWMMSAGSKVNILAERNWM